MSTEEVTPTEEQVTEEVAEEVESAPTENEESESSEEQTEEEERPPKGRDAESRIKELNWKAKQAADEAQKWRELFLDVQKDQLSKQQPKQEVEAQKEPEIPPAPLPPDRFDYDSDEEFRQAQQKFAQDNAKYFRNIYEQDRQAEQRKYQEQQRQQVLSSRQQTLSQKLDAGKEKYHDFEQVISNPAVPIDETMVEGLTDAENSADIAYYLASNPAEAQQIAGMQPIQKLMAIGKLDVKLGASTKKTTKAPPPPETVSAAASTHDIDPDKMSADEWLQWRNKQLAERR